MTPRWPSILWVVRYGQSAGNVARDAADAAGDLRIALDHRDVDVPLSRLGEEQSRALGEWFAEGQEGCAASDRARKAPPSGGAFPGSRGISLCAGSPPRTLPGRQERMKSSGDKRIARLATQPGSSRKNGTGNDA